MKHLPTVNGKSNYAANGIQYAEVANLAVPPEVTDPVQRFHMEIERHKLMQKYLAQQVALVSCAVKIKQLEQVDKLHNIKTAFRNPEVKNFDALDEMSAIGEHKEDKDKDENNNTGL